MTCKKLKITEEDSCSVLGNDSRRKIKIDTLHWLSVFIGVSVFKHDVPFA